MTKEFNVSIEGNDWTNTLDEVFNKKQKDLKIDGFRKGQVSKDIYIKKFGVESLYMDAVDAIMPKLYEKLYNENKDLEPATYPTMDIKTINDKSIEVIFKVLLKPEVKLGKYNGFGLKKEEVNVTEEEIEHEISHVRDQFAEMVVKDDDAVIKEGDSVTIDFNGFVDGKEFEGGKSENYELNIGSHSFIQGFEEGLVGFKKGEETELNLKFPDDYHAEEFKGKDVVFKVKIKEIKARILPELNEEFFKDLGEEGVDSLDKFKEVMKKDILDHKQKDADFNFIDTCLKEAVKNAKFDVPEEMVTAEVERMYEEFSNQVKSQGMEMDMYLNAIKSSVDDLKENFKDEGKSRIGFRLVVEAIIKKEDIKVSDEEVEKELDNMALTYNMTKEDVIKNIGNKEYLRSDLQVKKAFELITK